MVFSLPGSDPWGLTFSYDTVLDYAFARYRGDLNKFELIDTPHLHSDQA